MMRVRAIEMIRITCALLLLFGISLPGAVRASHPNDVTILLSSMNAARRSSHLRPLRLDRRLCRIAYDHALDMKRRNYYEHTTPEGLSPFARMAASNYPFGYAGENLAVDQDARVIFRDFWTSREHRSNMLGPHYARVGIASIEAAVGTIVVEDFSD